MHENKVIGSPIMHEIKVIGLLIAHENKVIACGQILRPGILASSCEVYGGFVGTREFVCTWKRPDLGRVQRIYAHLAFLLHRLMGMLPGGCRRTAATRKSSAPPRKNRGHRVLRWPLRNV